MRTSLFRRTPCLSQMGKSSLPASLSIPTWHLISLYRSQNLCIMQFGRGPAFLSSCRFWFCKVQVWRGWEARKLPWILVCPLQDSLLVLSQNIKTDESEVNSFSFPNQSSPAISFGDRFKLAYSGWEPHIKSYVVDSYKSYIWVPLMKMKHVTVFCLSDFFFLNCRTTEQGEVEFYHCWFQTSILPTKATICPKGKIYNLFIMTSHWLCCFSIGPQMKSSRDWASKSVHGLCRLRLQF